MATNKTKVKQQWMLLFSLSNDYIGVILWTSVVPLIYTQGNWEEDHAPEYSSCKSNINNSKEHSYLWLFCDVGGGNCFPVSLWNP